MYQGKGTRQKSGGFATSASQPQDLMIVEKLTNPPSHKPNSSTHKKRPPSATTKSVTGTSLLNTTYKDWQVREEK